jgi:hypothetical protein
MKQKYIFPITLALLFVFTLWTLVTQTPTSVYLTNQASEGFGWNLITHQGTNASFWWLGFNNSLENPFSSAVFIGLAAILLTVILLNNWRTSLIPLWQNACASLTFLGLILLLFGPDIVVFIFLIQFLGLILIYKSLRTNLANGLWVALLMAACALFLSSQWSYIVLSIAGLLVWQYRAQAKKESLTLQLNATLVVITLFLALALNIMFQRPNIPSFGYPPSARVVPDDGVAGIITPLIGETSEIPYINRSEIKSALNKPILFLSCFGLLLPLLARPSSRKILPITVILVTTLFLDILLPDSLAQIAPIKSMRRLLPGIFPLPLSLYLFALTLCLVFIDLLAKRFVLLTFMALLFIQAFFYGSFFPLSDTNTLSQNSLSASEKLILASPSSHLIKIEGLDTIQRLLHLKEIETKTVRELNGNITASHQKMKKLTKILSDEKYETRWSPTRGAQYGDEWIQIDLPNRIAVEGIKLLTGKYFSDFPRGLEIIDCSTPETPQKKIKSIPNWQGGIEISSYGYPYYTAQHDVSIIFPQEVTLNCLRINQIAENLHYDWSIAELRLLSH